MQSFVDNASRIVVTDGCQSIKTNQIPSSRFLDPSNPLIASDTDIAVENHHTSTRVVSYEEFGTFLASSSLVHAQDGWIYLAHAVESYLKGDQGIAIHLAYYAELRGAMSFLASEGIAVLNNKHLATDATNAVVKFGPKMGTHAFTWLAVDKYLLSNSKPKSDILKIFQYSGKNFLEWLNAIPNSSTVISDEIIRTWLKQWTFELSLLKSDRGFRNEFSYRPSKATLNPLINYDRAIKELSAHWRLLEPQNSSPFKLLDQFLLKKFLKEVHNYIELSLSRSIDYEQLLVDTFTNLRINISPAERSFFLSINDHQLFNSASSTVVDPVTGIDPICIIARSTLLLRLCVGYSSSDLKNKGISKVDLEFYTATLGKNNGLWNLIVPNKFESLWDSVGSSVEEINIWANGRTTNISLDEMNLELANDLIYYKQFNRAGLWGMDL